MTDVSPSRNLPGVAESWGRDIGDRTQLTEVDLGRLRQQVENLARSIAGANNVGGIMLGLLLDGGLDGVIRVVLEEGQLAITGRGNAIATTNPPDWVYSTWDYFDYNMPTISGAENSLAMQGARTTDNAYDAIAIGDNTVVDAGEGIAIGRSNIIVDGWRAIAIGAEAKVLYDEAIAIGSEAEAHGLEDIAIGNKATAEGTDGFGNVVIGGDAHAWGSGIFNIALGYESIAGREDVDIWQAVAIGAGAEATEEGAMSIGAWSQAYGEQGIAIGGSSGAWERAVAIGEDAWAEGAGSVAIGDDTWADGDESTALGTEAGAYGGQAAALGHYAIAEAPNSLAIGTNATSDSPASAAIGSDARVIARERTVFGMRDLEVNRPAPRIADDDGTYGTSPETGIILADSDGVKWRITVDTSGALQTALAAPLDEYGWPEVPGSGLSNWSTAATSADGSVIIAGRGERYGSAGYIATSTDGGVTFTDRTASPGSRCWKKIVCSSDGSIALAWAISPNYTVTDNTIWRSTNYGATWSAARPYNQYWKGIDISADGQVMIAWDGTVLHISTNAGASWTTRPLGAGVGVYPQEYEMALSGDGSTIVMTSGEPTAVRISRDGGVTWTAERMPFDSATYLNSVAIDHDGSHIAASFRGRLASSTDGGATWTERETHGTQYAVRGMSSDGGIILAGHYASYDVTGASLYLSYDDGATWKYVNNSFSARADGRNTAHMDAQIAKGGSRKISVPALSSTVYPVLDARIYTQA